MTALLATGCALFAVLAAGALTIAFLLTRELRHAYDTARQDREAMLAEHRDDVRELLNRVQHPTVMPMKRSVPQPPDPTESARDRARRNFLSVGHAAPPAYNGAGDDDDLGTDVP